MRRLYKFLLAIAHPFTFGVLLMICIICLYKSSDYKQWVLSSVSREISGPILNVKAKCVEYMNLQVENDRLAKQNKNLLTLLYNHNRNENTIETVYHGDSLLFIYHSAKIVESIINKHSNNYLVVDKGYDDGIRKGMGILAPEGVVGVIKDVSPNFAVVLPILHPQFSVMVKVKNTTAGGVLTWDAANMPYTQINNLPHIENVKVADTILTQHSLVFPPDYPVGVITSISHNTVGGFFSIKVRLFVSYEKLNNLYIIEQRYTEELEHLMERAEIND